MGNSYTSYFEFWLDNSENVCECCIYNGYLSCDNCDKFYKLTDEECKELGLSLNSPWAPEGWNCQNTDFRFCKIFKNSPCEDCCNHDGYRNFSGNGLIK